MSVRSREGLVLTPITELLQSAGESKRVDLVEGLVALGCVTVLYGAPMAGKSQLAAAITASLLAGVDFAGCAVRSCRRAAWVVADRHPEATYRVLMRALEGVGAPELGSRILSAPVDSLRGEDAARALCEQLDAARVELLVVDGAAHGDLHTLASPARAVVVTQSWAPPNGANGEIHARLRAGVGEILALDVRSRESPPRTLQVRRDITPASLAFKLVSSADHEPSDLEARIVETLRRLGPSNTGTVVRELHGNRNKIIAALKALVAAGYVSSSRAGKSVLYSAEPPDGGAEPP